MLVRIHLIWKYVIMDPIDLKLCYRDSIDLEICYQGSDWLINPFSEVQLKKSLIRDPIEKSFIRDPIDLEICY